MAPGDSYSKSLMKSLKEVIYLDDQINLKNRHVPVESLKFFQVPQKCPGQGRWISTYQTLLIVSSGFGPVYVIITGYHASFPVDKLYSCDKLTSNLDVSEHSNNMTEKQQHNILATPYSKHSSILHNPGRHQKN